MNDVESSLIKFIHFSEGLKKELRNGYTSNDKRESVAEHTWRVSLMVMVLSKFLDNKICLERALKISIVHDLAEIITGDKPYFEHEGQPELEVDKGQKELRAMEQIKDLLPEIVGEELFQLWKEYEDGVSPEAKFVKAIDKIEAQIQHNEMSYQHWNDHDRKLASTRLDNYCNFDSFLMKIKHLVQEESRLKIKAIE